MSEHKEKRRYTREFKVEAVRLYEASEKSMREIERELGITPYLLSKWVQQFREREAAAFPGKGKLPETEVELQRLRREVEILRQERDILKKAVIIFSEPKR
jgi:transposase